MLTAGLLALFCTVVFQGAQQADFASLTAVADWRAAPACVPIIFLSLVRPSACRVSAPTTRIAMLNGL